MAHSINQEGQLVKVNHRWLNTLGYNMDEVIGQQSVDFLTDEPRWWVIQDALPLFWQGGSARSIGYRFLRKNGRALTVLMDAEVVPRTEGDLSSLATLRRPDSLSMWRQSSTTLRRLRTLHRVQRQLENLLRPKGGGIPDSGASEDPRISPLALDPTSTRELFGTLVGLGQDISSSLRALSQAHLEGRDASLEQQGELVLAMKSIDKTLTEIKDVLGDTYGSE